MSADELLVCIGLATLGGLCMFRKHVLEREVVCGHMAAADDDARRSAERDRSCMSVLVYVGDTAQSPLDCALVVASSSDDLPSTSRNESTHDADLRQQETRPRPAACRAALHGRDRSARLHAFVAGPQLWGKGSTTAIHYGVVLYETSVCAFRRRLAHELTVLGPR